MFFFLVIPQQKLKCIANIKFNSVIILLFYSYITSKINTINYLPIRLDLKMVQFRLYGKGIITNECSKNEEKNEPISYSVV